MKSNDVKRKVDMHGCVWIKGKRFFVSKDKAGEEVTVSEDWLIRDLKEIL